MNEKREGKVISIAGAASDWLDEAVGEYASWTDEQWARHDAQVAAQRAAEEGAKHAEERELAAAARRRELVRYGVPPNVLDALAGDVRETKAMEIMRWLLDPGAFARHVRVVVLSGPRGVGKTFAAAWWVAQEHPSHPDFEATPPPMFIDGPGLARWPRYDEERMHHLTRVRAMVLDELGVEYDDKSGAFMSLLEEVVNARYKLQLPTVITTNLPVDAFRARYGERVADRIREVGRFVSLTGESLRQRKEGDRA